MKLVTNFLVIFLFIVPLQSASAKSQSKNIVTLTAGAIDSADDIEAAIINITMNGTRPGTVILDGQDGAFVFTGDDRSLNIFVSSLTLRGVNRAMIVNCDDGLFFDDFPIKHILVEGISFLCTGDGIEATGEFQDVTLRNNIFWARNNGIGISGASSDWMIRDNLIQADKDGMRITGAENVVIANNYLSGSVGISLLTCAQFQVHRNTIQATSQGVMLGRESWENQIQGNTILGVYDTGIFLEHGVVGNHILANRVICRSGIPCLTVETIPEVADSNLIAGNKP